MREGRDFEKLVASFEDFAKLKSLKIQSPEYIKGRLTEVLREVDITLRGNVGLIPILIAIECRDRTKVQGVDWISEIVTKKEDIGADVIIVASTADFSQGAKQIAEKKDIFLRNLKNFKPEETEKWFGNAVIDIETKNIELGKVNVQLYDVSQKFINTIKKTGVSNKVALYNSSNGKKIDLLKFLNNSPIKDDILSKNIIINKTQKCFMEFVDDELRFYTMIEDKKIFIKQINFDFSIKVKNTNAPLKSISHYIDPLSDSLLVQSANFYAKVGDDEFNVKMFKDEKTGEQKVIVDSSAKIMHIKVESDNQK